MRTIRLIVELGILMPLLLIPGLIWALLMGCHHCEEEVLAEYYKGQGRCHHCYGFTTQPGNYCYNCPPFIRRSFVD